MFFFQIMYFEEHRERLCSERTSTKALTQYQTKLTDWVTHENFLRKGSSTLVVRKT